MQKKCSFSIRKTSVEPVFLQENQQNVRPGKVILYVQPKLSPHQQFVKTKRVADMNHFLPLVLENITGLSKQYFGLVLIRVFQAFLVVRLFRETRLSQTGRQGLKGLARPQIIN